MAAQSGRQTIGGILPRPSHPPNQIAPALSVSPLDRRIRPINFLQSDSADKGGGLGALTTLARAVEQEERREELSLQLTKEVKALDVLGAEVGKRVPGGAVVQHLSSRHNFALWGL